MGNWANAADQVIKQVHSNLNEGATYAERKKALSAAYPFGERHYSPYKTWLRKVKAYLVKYETPAMKARRLPPESPLERLILGGPL